MRQMGTRVHPRTCSPYFFMRQMGTCTLPHRHGHAFMIVHRYGDTQAKKPCTNQHGDKISENMIKCPGFWTRVFYLSCHVTDNVCSDMDTSACCLRHACGINLSMIQAFQHSYGRSIRSVLKCSCSQGNPITAAPGCVSWPRSCSLHRSSTNLHKHVMQLVYLVPKMCIPK